MPNFNNPFPSWGDVGQSPPDGFQYSGGDQVREDHLDFIWYQQNIVTSNIIDEFDRLDSNNDGQVDSADVADSGSDPFSLVGDLNAADGETIWDETATHIPQGRLENDSVTIANNVVSLGGSTPINHSDLSNVGTDNHHNQNHGNEDHDVNYTTLTEVNNNADVPNADYADSAGVANDTSFSGGFIVKDPTAYKYAVAVNENTSNYTTHIEGNSGGDWRDIGPSETIQLDDFHFLQVYFDISISGGAYQDAADRYIRLIDGSGNQLKSWSSPNSGSYTFTKDSTNETGSLTVTLQGRNTDTADSGGWVEFTRTLYQANRPQTTKDI